MKYNSSQLQDKNTLYAKEVHHLSLMEQIQKKQLFGGETKRIPVEIVEHPSKDVMVREIHTQFVDNIVYSFKECSTIDLDPLVINWQTTLGGGGGGAIPSNEKMESIVSKISRDKLKVINPIEEFPELDVRAVIIGHTHLHAACVKFLEGIGEHEQHRKFTPQELDACLANIGHPKAVHYNNLDGSQMRALGIQHNKAGENILHMCSNDRIRNLMRAKNFNKIPRKTTADVTATPEYVEKKARCFAECGVDNPKCWYFTWRIVAFSPDDEWDNLFLSVMSQYERYECKGQTKPPPKKKMNMEEAMKPPLTYPQIERRLIEMLTLDDTPSGWERSRQVLFAMQRGEMCDKDAYKSLYLGINSTTVKHQIADLAQAPFTEFVATLDPVHVERVVNECVSEIKAAPRKLQHEKTSNFWEDAWKFQFVQAHPNLHGRSWNSSNHHPTVLNKFEGLKQDIASKQVEIKGKALLKEHKEQYNKVRCDPNATEEDMSKAGEEYAKQAERMPVPSWYLEVPVECRRSLNGNLHIVVEEDYLNNQWKNVPIDLNYTCLFLDIWYGGMPSTNAAEPELSQDDFKKLVNHFKSITTATNFTIVCFCGFKQVWPFFETLKEITNITPEICFWTKLRNKRNNIVKKHCNDIETFLIGYHQVGATEGGVKAVWQSQYEFPTKDNPETGQLKLSEEDDGSGTDSDVSESSQGYVPMQHFQTEDYSNNYQSRVVNQYLKRAESNKKVSVYQKPIELCKKILDRIGFPKYEKCSSFVVPTLLDAGCGTASASFAASMLHPFKINTVAFKLMRM